MRVVSISRKILPLLTTAIIGAGVVSCKKNSPAGENSSCNIVEQKDVFINSDKGKKTPVKESYNYADEIDTVNGTKYHTVRKANGQLLRYNEYAKGDDSAWTRECEYNAEYYADDGIKKETWYNFSGNTVCTYYYDSVSGNLERIINEYPCDTDTIFIGNKYI